MNMEDNFCAKVTTGLVLEGFGKAKEYIRIYQNEIKDKIGIVPFYGTINLQVQKLPFFSPDKAILVNKQNYGDILLYPAKINNQYKVWILRPLKTDHPDDIVELIAETKLPINLGDELICELE
tara:strand:+ start:667 stop:1035 length:369 start_codon:yes stop_codon:yes gene_type:complete